MRDLFRGLGSFLTDPTGQALLGIASVIVAVGTVFYRFVEDLLWVDSIYFSVITLTTVGYGCLLYTSPSPRDRTRSRMPSSA